MSKPGQTIVRNGSKPSIKGPESFFTGNVRIDGLFPPRRYGLVFLWQASLAWRFGHDGNVPLRDYGNA